MPEHDVTERATIVVASWKQLWPHIPDDGEAGWAKALMDEAVDALDRSLAEPAAAPTGVPDEVGPGRGSAAAARSREQRKADKVAMARAMAESGE